LIDHVGEFGPLLTLADAVPTGVVLPDVKLRPDIEMAVKLGSPCVETTRPEKTKAWAIPAMMNSSIAAVIVLMIIVVRAKQARAVSS
jgi:hypothetical protein